MPNFPSPRTKNASPLNFGINTIYSTDQEHTQNNEKTKIEISIEDNKIKNGTSSLVLKNRLNIDSGDRFA